jgi:hypothetical protein
VTIAKIEPVTKFDLGEKLVPWKQRHANGQDSTSEAAPSLASLGRGFPFA